MRAPSALLFCLLGFLVSLTLADEWLIASLSSHYPPNLPLSPSPNITTTNTSIGFEVLRTGDGNTLHATCKGTFLEKFKAHEPNVTEFPRDSAPHEWMPCDITGTDGRVYWHLRERAWFGGDNFTVEVVEVKERFSGDNLTLSLSGALLSLAHRGICSSHRPASSCATLDCNDDLNSNDINCRLVKEVQLGFVPMELNKNHTETIKPFEIKSVKMNPKYITNHSPECRHSIDLQLPDFTTSVCGITWACGVPSPRPNRWCGNLSFANWWFEAIPNTASNSVFDGFTLRMTNRGQMSWLDVNLELDYVLEKEMVLGENMWVATNDTWGMVRSVRPFILPVKGVGLRSVGQALRGGDDGA